MAVEIFQQTQQFVSPAQNLRFWKGTAAQFEQLREIVARNELHNEKIGFVFTEVVNYLWQTRITQVRKESRFTLEGPFGLGVLRGKHFFQCNKAIRPLVQSFVDSAHATVPQLADDAIAVLKDSVGVKHKHYQLCRYLISAPNVFRSASTRGQCNSSTSSSRRVRSSARYSKRRVTERWPSGMPSPS